MAYVKKSGVDRIEIVEPYKQIQVRVMTWIEDDSDNSMVGSKAITRYVICPGEDYSDKPASVKAVCDVEHTDAVKKTYADYVATLS